MILEDTAHIRPCSLPIAVYPTDSSSAADSEADSSLFPVHGLSLQEHERVLLVQALEKTGGNQSKSAILLGITRDTFRYKMKKFKLR